MKISSTNKIAKQGVNLIRSIADDNDCLFHEIQQENDLGIDAIIEFSEKKIMTGKSIGVQIKSGSSYINYAKGTCAFPIGNHLDYWTAYDLPVYGFVCDVKKKKFYYVNIKRHIENYNNLIKDKKINSIIFDITFSNSITVENFDNLFKNVILGRLPRLSFNQALQLLESDHANDIALAFRCLRNYYYDKVETWDAFLSSFRNPKYSFIHHWLITYFSYGTHNPDLMRCGDSEICSKWATEKILTFTGKDIVRLLEYVDEENHFCRGSIGEAIDFIIRLIPDKVRTLIDIAENEQNTNNVRENALFLIACYDSQTYLKLDVRHRFDFLLSVDDYLLKYGYINPYA